MSLTVTQGNQQEFEITPEGTYIARCFKVIDLGTQTVEWMGEKKFQQKVLVSWELLDPATKMKDDRPFAVTKKYTASLHEKAQLRKDLQNWRGKRFTDEELAGFDLKSILGAYCQIQVVHAESNGNTYANVDAIMSTREKPTGVNPLVHFDITDPDMKVFEGLSERLRGQIEASPEWRARDDTPVEDEVVTDVGDEPINLDDIPF